MADENKKPEGEASKTPVKSEAAQVDSNLLAALSYLWILSIIFYVLKKDDSYVQFHSRQGIVLFGLSLVGMVPFIGWPIGLIALVLIVIGALKAYQGEKYKMPLISDLAEKINF